MEKTRKRINEIIENRGTWTIILLSIVFVAALTSFMYLKPKDCLWNFSNILKVCNGNTIYKDINIIVTPMFFFLGTVLFKALGTNYFVYIIYNVILWTCIFTVTYKLFVQLFNKKTSAFYITLLVMVYSLILIMACANYNILSMFFFLLGIVLKNKFENKKIDVFVQGLMCFVVFFTKQNVGAIYVLSTCILNIYNFYKEKDKKYLKELFWELAVAGVLVLLFLAGLYLKGCINQFISYAVLGLGEFAKYNMTRFSNRFN